MTNGGMNRERRAQVRLKDSKVAELVAEHGVPIAVPGEAPGEKPESECALIVTVDPWAAKPVILLTRRAVSDWGALSERSHHDVVRDHFEPGEPVTGFVGRELARKAGFLASDFVQVERLVVAAHRLFTELDCLWVEFNPIIKTKDGFKVLRATIEVNDEALYRHPTIEDQVVPHPASPPSDREKTARAAGLIYYDLDGDIGILPGGMGIGLAIVDLVHQVGGAPANLLDSGGEQTAHHMKVMLDLLMDNPKVLVVLCCRFGGLSRCDDWARAVIPYIIGRRDIKPMVLRLGGNNEDDARRLFDEAARANPEAFYKVRIFYSSTAVDNVAREAVALAEAMKKGEDPHTGEGVS